MISTRVATNDPPSHNLSFNHRCPCYNDNVIIFHFFHYGWQEQWRTTRSRTTEGSKTTPQFRDYISEDERKKFVEFVLDQYMGDIRLALWLGEQVFGKAPQPLTGPEGGPIQIQGVEITVRKK